MTSAFATPAFVWTATGTVRGLPVSVVDAYVGGRGTLAAVAWGWLPLATAVGPAADKGEAQRFLGELAWNPGALLHCEDLRWAPTDDPAVVDVSLAVGGGGRGDGGGGDGSAAATVRLTFDGRGDLVAADAADRPRAEGDGAVPTAWRGTVGDYGDVGGVRLPRRAEAAWLLPGGPFVYWRGVLTGWSSQGGGVAAGGTSG